MTTFKSDDLILMDLTEDVDAGVEVPVHLVCTKCYPKDTTPLFEGRAVCGATVLGITESPDKLNCDKCPEAWDKHYYQCVFL